MTCRGVSGAGVGQAGSGGWGNREASVRERAFEVALREGAGFQQVEAGEAVLGGLSSLSTGVMLEGSLLSMTGVGLGYWAEQLTQELGSKDVTSQRFRAGNRQYEHGPLASESSEWKSHLP